MSDLGDDFRAMDEAKKERHQKWYDENMRVLIDSRIPFIRKETAVLFREEGKPKIDFYPHTGRWKSNGRMYSGGAEKFLKWYRSK